MAEGRPLPKIEWKREDGQPIRAQQNGKKKNCLKIQDLVMVRHIIRLLKIRVMN